MIVSKDYMPDCRVSYTDAETYYNKTKTFGKFINDGRAYLIESRDTPREWLQYLCNDKIRSAISNTGKGFLWHCKEGFITKHWEPNYLVRNVNGRRTLLIKTADGCHDFFDDSEDFSETVHPGYVVFNGKIGEIQLELTVFVPVNAPCECYKISLTNLSDNNVKVDLSLSQDLMMHIAEITNFNDYQITAKNSSISAVFASKDMQDGFYEEKTEKDCNNNDKKITSVSLMTKCCLSPNEDAYFSIVSGVYKTDEEKLEISKLLDKSAMEKELEAVKEKWEGIFSRNHAILPDKNFEYFANYWLKNQLYLTFRYNRGEDFYGYRDVLQDSFGYCLVEPQIAKEKILTALSFMYPDGRAPRQYSPYDGRLDNRDFSDSPIWAVDAVSSYMKETGDFAFFEEKVGFYGSDEKSSVEDHIFRSLDYLYHSRGKNGLILIRSGDWADGLGGINKYGEGATSVWLTIATFYAQNILKNIYRYLGNYEKEKLMEERSKEYQKIVNEVGWNGSWFTYGFFEDGEPIGSPTNLEGKIWLNPQTWALFSGIVTEGDRIEKINKAINRYLLTPFGSMVCYPPYVFHGDRCGRVWRQLPGTFLNGAIYNHGASFKVFADIARGDVDDAYDSFMRTLPNHPDNSDCCRTSEPYTVGNVYFGPNNPRYGMNLFSWFTATPAWLIHAAFEQILGVKVDFDGIEISPNVPKEWQEYTVIKEYMGTKYHINFLRKAEQRGILVDGVPIKGNVVNSKQKECHVTVYF